jgi:hypothetical protein
VAPDDFYEHTDERIGGSIRKKDEIDTERVTVSKRYRAR